MKKVFIALLSCFVIPAMADTTSSSSDESSKNIYIDVNIGNNFGNRYDVNVNNSFISANSSGSFALGTNIGYMFIKYVGAEVGFTGTSNYGLTDIAAKGVLPLGPVDIYGKLGLGVSYYTNSNATQTNTNTGMLYGAGVAYNFNKSWQIHIEDYSITGTNPNFLMVGGGFRF